MSIGKISGRNAPKLSAYAEIQQRRERRAAVREMQQRNAAQAQTFASIQTKNSVQQGNLASRIAMQRMTGKFA